MGAKTAGLASREGATLSVLKWIMGEFGLLDTLRQFDSAASLRRALDSEAIDILLLDADAVAESLSGFMRELQDKKPDLKTILIISPTAKDAIMEIITANLVKGIVVKPFTKDAVSRYMKRLV